jgi:hypothetical protein
MLVFRAILGVAIGLCVALGLLLTASHLTASGAPPGGQVIFASLVASAVFFAQAFVVAGLPAQGVQIARLMGLQGPATRADRGRRAGRAVLHVLVGGLGVAVVLGCLCHIVLLRLQSGFVVPG